MKMKNKEMNTTQ